jgi:hypothetical protein
MPFESFSHVPVTEELLQHVWEGEVEANTGGHRFGLGREGKTEFPQHWTLHMVRQSIEVSLFQPQWLQFLGLKTLLFREVTQVLVAIELRRNRKGLYLFTAYPLCGVGVYRNQQGLKVSLPLELPKWES